MKVAVVGLGLFGKSLAVRLARGGAQVIAIDANPALVDDVKDDVPVAVALDATDEKELRAQGVQECDVLVASIGDNFEANQLLVITAKQIGVKRVVARAPSAVHGRILRLIGADDVVLPELEAAERTAMRVVEPSLRGYFQLIEGHSVVELEAPEEFYEKTLGELDLKGRYKVNLVMIIRPVEGGRRTINVVMTGASAILKGDILALAGRDEDIKKLIEGKG